jgi:hypothetical protein
MAGNGKLAPPKIWIVHDASALPDHEIQLLARLVQNFPGANIRVILLMTVASQKQKLLNSFGRRILSWDVEPPTPEQAELMMQQATSDGREFAARSLLKKIYNPDTKVAEKVRPPPVLTNPEVPAEKIEDEPSLKTNPPKRLRLFFIAISVLGLSILSVLAFQRSALDSYFSVNNLKDLLVGKSILSQSNNKVASPVTLPPIVAPQLSASNSLAVAPAASVTAVVTPPVAATIPIVETKSKESIDAVSAVISEPKPVKITPPVKEVIPIEIPQPDLQIGQAWVKKMPRGTFLVQHVALPSVQEALIWVQKHPNLKNARVVATYLPNQKATQYSIVSGPFASLVDATAFAESPGLPRDPMIRSARFMKEQFSPEQADADAKKRKESKR